MPGEAPSSESSNPVSVVVDDRETRSGVMEQLSQLPGVKVRVQRLAVGDYDVDGRCLFERKTLSDFARSLADQRLFMQASRLVATRPLVALVLEGRGSDLAKSGMRREALQGALISLSLIFGIPVLRSMDPAETARLLIYAASQLRRRVSNASLWRCPRPAGRRRQQLAILQSLPGIGPARARDLLACFGHVQAVMTAEANQLEIVPGIGKKTASAIRSILEPNPRPEASP